MARQNDNSIICRLPREIQIQCLQFLVPNQRLLVVGDKNVGKTTFINRLREQEEQCINKKGIQIMESNTDKCILNKKPTKIIFMCDATSGVSMSQIYNHYIPKHKHLQIPFTIIINKTDISPSKWKIADIIIMKKKIHEFEEELGTTIPIHWLSDKKKYHTYHIKTLIAFIES